MIAEHELAQVIFRHTTAGYDLTSTGKLSFRVRAEKAAREIALMIRTDHEREHRHHVHPTFAPFNDVEWAAMEADA